ncbi:GNAT family N-acetyltransferase [Sporolactobacillus shoreae]|uniref:GNAT family N-acetyltransferase n=1 Tax=Sporolactobacillus shoreae TaxID=1465501 RepID=A0A4Z0GKX0_9BACL|nr:GNAT family N-acetyltransferase [Sporolactobacillus shoreae]TGA96274.1 GNAT family N-acetyltransferase [Sporolactobacillus shoreae]
MKPYLDEPSKDYRSSFQNYANSYRDTSEDAVYFSMYGRALDDFDDFLTDLRNAANNINIPEDWVAASTFWLIDHDQVVGVVRIRHQEVESAGHIGYDIAPQHRKKGYGSLILKLALAEAQKLGLQKVIITCRTDNEPSKRIIEKNGGRLLGTLYDEEEHADLFRYVIMNH